MKLLGQKEAVIAEILTELPMFQKYVDNALLKLTTQQLETIKSSIYSGIISGIIEYSKDRTNLAEVRTYARSMVMNHIKKAKELNGGHVYQSNVSSSTLSQTAKPITVRVKAKLAPKGVNPDLLPEDLKEFVKTLV